MRIALLIICIGSSLIGEAQTRTDRAQLEWGDEFRTMKRIVQKGLVLSDQSGYYNLVLEGIGSKPVLQKFDNSLRLVQSQELLLSSDESALSFKFIQSLGNKIFAFGGQHDSKTLKYALYYSSINKDTLEKNEDCHLVMELEYEKTELDFNSGKFQHVVSKDNAKLLIHYRRPTHHGENERFGFKIYDQDMELIIEKDVELPYPEEHFALETVKLGIDGTVYIVGKVFDQTRSQTQNGDANNHFAVVAYYPDAITGKVYPISLEEKYISDIQITIQEDLDIVCVGFYSEKGTNSLRGTYYLKIDRKTASPVDQSVRDFSVEFLNHGLRERKLAKNGKKVIRKENAESYQLELSEIITRDDGGAILVGEQSWINMVTTASGGANGSGSTITTYFYNYLDIFVVSINPEGYIEWYQKVPKKQITSNDGGMFSSYGLKVVKNNVFFIFNDHPENLFYSQGEPATFSANKRRFLPMFISIDMNGNVEREALMNQSDGDLYLRPKSMVGRAKNELISYGHGKRNHRLARIKFIP
ncbi:MAG: hypothetical protein HN542_04700 [Flavobacteriales bacterium]|nr:hypothetical protein [Flavobacteriales bacterium]NCG30873.1 hypothetical protein [Bacteroidota bacterium]MBT3963883.1 hypothetical protein [Flavobacteriales bacterium]MBT4706209.1 hypothetical protein [Flavobacteriales bacterium]MBT4931394.1 hypothetical protein [Flavobacteriales bacterium]